MKGVVVQVLGQQQQQQLVGQRMEPVELVEVPEVQVVAQVEEIDG